jgi:hypothetical protein
VPAARFYPLVAFLIPLVVYGLTLAPSLPPQHDSGELTTAAAVLGIAHPPGYPLYTLVGHLFSLLPVGEVAWRLNLMSACFVALASGLLAAALGRLCGSPAAAFGAALLWAFAVTPWRLAVGAEVFPLHLALLAGLILVAARWQAAAPPERPRWVMGAALLLGLGLAHHLTLVLALPGLVAFAWLSRGRTGLGPWALGALALGLLPYAYLPLRAAQHPPLNWGDPSTWERFVWVVSRAGYGTLALSVHTGGSAAYHLQALARSLAAEQFPFPLALLGLAGLAAWRSRAPAVALFTLIFVGFGPLFVGLSPPPPGEGYADMMERFYASAYMGFAGLVALGMAGLARRWRALSYAWWVLPGLSLALHYPLCTQAGNWLVRDTVLARLEPLPAGAVLVSGSDLGSGSALYLQRVEGVRPDVQLIFPGLLNSSWYLDQLPPELARAARSGDPLPSLVAACQARGRPVFLDYRPAGGLAVVPYGLTYRCLAPGEGVPAAGEQSLQILEKARVRADLTRGRTFWERELVAAWGRAWLETGQALVGENPARAVEALNRGLALDPGSARGWMALGQARLALEQPEQAQVALQRSVELDPASARAWLYLGLARLAGGQTEKAEEALLASVQLDPRQRPARVALAQLYLKMGRPEEAARWLK